jgi:hypothetical protein
MNEKQKKVVWAVLAIITLMALFPVKESGNGNLIGRGFLYASKMTLRHGKGSVTYSVSVDLETLIAQMIPVIAIGGGVFISLKDLKDSNEK